jgi:hypothetical protein
MQQHLTLTDSQKARIDEGGAPSFVSIIRERINRSRSGEPADTAARVLAIFRDLLSSPYS